ncbi:thiol reductase thioredoxin [Paenibacillus sp. 598K]|uniref:thioredoxin family protein n=1 Tax=Paenibacillus sp. 598K TaxID=1117987 RepID=UPI000FFB05F6|nr:thioredoxin family protein [Paenibacillus sp. 598K]GBF74474.1 thiol reductase thioredoxin [Paenibacillus sp. 598K]
MKKMGIFLGIIVILFAAIFVLNKSNVNDLYKKPVSELNPQTRAILDDPNYQNIILPDELESKIASSDGTFIYYFASDCSFCKQTTPVLMPIAEQAGVDLPQFNLREFDSYFQKMGIQFTPTLAYYENGALVDKMEGGVAVDGGTGYTEQQFADFFNKHKG